MNTKDTSVDPSWTSCHRGHRAVPWPRDVCETASFNRRSRA